MARFALSLTILAVMAAPVCAEVAVEPGAPFTAPQLTAALAVRGATSGDIWVRALSATAVELRTATGSQRVELGAARGAVAARLIALQLVPLTVDPSLPAPAVIASNPQAPAGPGWTIDAMAGGGRGVTAIDLALTTLRADVAFGGGWWRIGGGAGWMHGLARAAGAMHTATADFAVARGFAGLATGPLALFVGPELVGYRVTSVPAGVTMGVSSSFRVQLGGGAGWQAIASADVDAFSHRVVFSRDGAELVATPNVALTAALGVAWEGR